MVYIAEKQQKCQNFPCHNFALYGSSLPIGYTGVYIRKSLITPFV